MSHAMLELTVDQGSVRARVTCRRGGELVGGYVGQGALPAVLDASAEILRILETQCDRAGTTFDVQDLREQGERLGRLLLGDDLLEQLRRRPPESLLVQLAPELSHVPVELIWMGAGFLGRQTAVGVQFPGDLATESNRLTAENQRPEANHLRAMLLADSTFELLYSQYEAADVMHLWKRHRDVMVVDDDWNLQRTSVLTIRDALLSLAAADWLHLSGHTARTDDSIQRGWLFRDGLLTAETIRTSGSHQAPRFVFAHACAAANTNTDESGSASLVEELGRRGCRHLLGPVVPVKDIDGGDFAVAFYASVLAGQSFGDAVRTAREHSVTIHGEANLYWAGLRLLGDPAIIPLPQLGRSVSLAEGLSENSLLRFAEPARTDKKKQRPASSDDQIRGRVIASSKSATRSGQLAATPQPVECLNVTETADADNSISVRPEWPAACSQCGREIHTRHGVGRRTQSATACRILCRRCARRPAAETAENPGATTENTNPNIPHKDAAGTPQATATPRSLQFVGSNSNAVPGQPKQRVAVASAISEALDTTQPEHEDPRVDELVERLRQRLPLEISLSAGQIVAETSLPESVVLAAMNKAAIRFRLHIDEVAPFGWVLS